MSAVSSLLCVVTLVLGPPSSRVMYSMVLSVMPNLAGLTGDKTGDCLVVGAVTNGVKLVGVGVGVGVKVPGWILGVV